MSAANAKDLLALCTDALREAGEPEAEACATITKRGFARFAIGALGQHMDIDDPSCIVRVAHGKRVAEARTTRLDKASLVQTIRDAAEAARFAPETEGFPGFADGKEPIADVPRYSEATANATPEERVERLTPAMRAIEAAGLVSAGALETSRYATAVATTRGCARSHDATVALYKVWALETPGAGGAAGYGGQMHRDVRKLDLMTETERAIRIAKASHDPISIDAGSYDVVMEPAAVSELFEWLSTIAFAASEVEQGTSPVAGRAGERVTGDRISISEDAVDASELGFGAPFDREGTARRKVPLIDGGIAREVLYDRTYGSRMKAASTGNAGDSGVSACAIHVNAGEAASVDELIAGMDRGLYVCRLHYVNGFLEPRRAVMTGLTRDGCFLVEKGKITRAVGNLRFTDSFLEGLARCDGMTKARTAIPTWWSDGGAMVVPAVRMRAFKFNGKSQERVRIEE